MTTIAVDMRRNEMAGDGLECWGDMVSRTDVKKIIVEKGKAIYALSGASGIMQALIDWEKAGASGPAPQCGPDINWTFLVLKASGERFTYVSKFPYPSPMPMVFAIGSGADHAVGAMRAGKTPAEAVKLIRDHRLDVWTGGDIQVVDIAEALGLAPPSVVTGRRQVSRIDPVTGRRKIRIEETAA